MALQAQQLVTLACQIAKVSGFTVQAGQLLNLILSDLCQTYDFDLARVTYNNTFNSAWGNNSGPYILPSDYLRSLKDDVYYTISGVPYVMRYAAADEFDNLVTVAGLTGYPTIYTTDLSVTPPQMWVWPPPSGSFPVTFKYFRQMPDITTPETSAVVPWFPNANYLLTRLAGELMNIADDERAVAFLGKGEMGAQTLLKEYLLMKDDRESQVKTVNLDPRRFGGTAFSTLPNTKAIGF